MNTLNAIDFAEMACGVTNDSIIVLDLHNGGSSFRWMQELPSLTPEQIGMLEDVTFLHFTSWVEAAETFQRLTRDCAQYATGIISGSITLVCRPLGKDDGIETRSWDLDNLTRPVLDGIVWRDEAIVEHA